MGEVKSHSASSITKAFLPDAQFYHSSDYDALQKENERLRADKIAIRNEQIDEWKRAENAEERAERAERELAEEREIVNRIWALFGNPSYEELKGRSIYDLVAAALERERECEEAIRLADPYMREHVACAVIDAVEWNDDPAVVRALGRKEEP